MTGNDTNEAREFLRGFLRLLSEETLRAISRGLYSELDSAELGPESDRIARYVLFSERELGEIRSIRAAEYHEAYS